MIHQGCRPGCDRLLESFPQWLRDKRLGLLANQGSVTAALDDLAAALVQVGARLVALFSPQHGYYAEKQANMIESEDGTHLDCRLKTYSLYGEHRRPTGSMLADIEVLLVDLQDVGTRVYTYAATLGLCLEAAAEFGTQVVVLDRPNPIGGEIEGNLLDPAYRSFVGRYRLPMRHGLTLGELARYINQHHRIGCALEVIAVDAWRRSMLYPQTGLPWVFPSPNMPGWETALLYPGLVLLEGTNVSEGRGTTLPFQLFGAPFLDQQRLATDLAATDLAGVKLRPVCFEPTFDKWRGERCRGFQIHLTDPRRVRPYRLGLALLGALWRTHGDRFAWLPPPYEYEYEKLPIDILLGDGRVREQIEQGVRVLELEAGWERELEGYRRDIQPHLLYPAGP